MLHIVDECIRWSVAIEIAGKTPEDIIDAIVTHWFKVYGKPELMIWDGERTMVSTEAVQWAPRQKLQLTQRTTNSWGRAPYVADPTGD